MAGTGPRRRWLLIGAGIACAALAVVLAVQALRVDPNTLYEQVLGDLEAGRIDAAEHGLSRLKTRRVPTVLDWGLWARVAIARGREAEALSALAMIPQAHALSAWAHLRAGQLRLRGRYLRLAEVELRRALEREPQLLPARRELIYILALQLRRRELDEQFALLSRSATLNAHEVWVWGMSRELVWWTPSEQAAILDDALRNDPDDRWSRLALAENRQRTGQAVLAESLLAALPESDLDARAVRAGFALEKGDTAAAAAILHVDSDDHVGLLTLRGRLALARGDGHEAVRCFQRVAASEPDNRRALAGLGQAWMLTGEPEKARPFTAAAGRITELNGLLLRAENRTRQPDPALWHRLGAACEAAGRLRQARSWYALLIENDPLDETAQQALHRVNSRRRPHADGCAPGRPPQAGRPSRSSDTSGAFGPAEPTGQWGAGGTSAGF